MLDVHIILAAPKKNKVKPLLQSKGLVIGVDGGAHIAIEESIELDFALGDFDSVSKRDYVEIKEKTREIHHFPSKKDDTDAELALLYILKNIQAKNIYFYNWNGGRLDHLQSILMLVLQDRFYSLIPKIHFISEKNKLSYYLPGKYEINKIEGMKYLSFILLTKVKNLTLDNVKYPLNKANYNSPRALISNEFINKKALLDFEKGIISVIQTKDSN